MDLQRRAQLYRTLTDETPEEAPDQRSVTRRALSVVAALLVLGSAPLMVATAAQGATDPDPVVLAKSAQDDDDDRDDRDDDREDNPRDDSVATSGTGERDELTDDATKDQDPGTGRETRAANTDQPGLETGASTRGETDARDDTGKTEAGAQTTGRETRAQQTDRPGLQTGVSTRGETDPGDRTGVTERR